ncbi:alpha/beta fold hydrolase [Nocardia sp. NBC_00881]|uniref:alpha/beta fold hydrolase n=1 Tax=Nocardia sp. NBC_00881 TaxID=2975995 RepID=UPI0038642C46
MKREDDEAFSMSTFVLIHGGSHGAWCWYKMIPRLESAGHRVLTLDLPGHGVDRTPLEGLTQHDYAAAVEAVLRTLEEPAVLVAHSMGGMTASLTAERCPEKIAAIVYLAAIVLNGGRSMMTDPDMARLFGELSSSLILDEQNAASIFPPELAIRCFYGDCDAADTALALRLLTPEPNSAMSTPIDVTAQRFGTVPRFGIQTLNDGLHPADLQQMMYKRNDFAEIVSLPTAHSPFLSAPDLLTEQLLYFADRARS